MNAARYRVAWMVVVGPVALIWDGHNPASAKSQICAGLLLLSAAGGLVTDRLARRQGRRRKD